MTDFAALQTYIESTPDLLALLESGANGVLVEQLDAPDVGNVPLEVDRASVVAAIGDGIRALPDGALQKLRILLGGELIDFRSQPLRDEIRELFAGNTDVLARLQSVAMRPKRLADRFDTTRVSLADVREIARRVYTSHYNKYQRGEV